MATGNAKNFELKIGKTGLIIIVFFMTVIFCAAFLFGVDVGKNIDTYPGEIAAIPQRALALVWRPARIKTTQNMPENKMEQTHQVTTAEPSSYPTGENIDLTFYKDLTNKKGLPKAGSSLDQQPLNMKPQNTEDQKGKFNIETSQPHEAVINGKNNEKEASKETKLLANNASNKNKYIIQAASLKEKEKAKQVNKKIEDLGFKSEIVKTDIKGKGTVYRVIAAGFNDKAEADKAAKKISAKISTNCIVKKNDSNISKN